MAIALYRKYRPMTFAEVISQEHVKTTLLNAVALGKVGHAYIFIGARGIGKTTIARLFAKSVNCQDRSQPEPDNKCDHCQTINDGKALDIIEIDAASNRGIEEIRELREKVKFTPSVLKYKVFIIDEVHMLTKEAFNALLKTLEEPPEHAIFLLATTEAHKVPATILSRCQRFDLKKLTVPELVISLNNIAKKEGVEVTQEALELIAQQSDGCARDAVSLFTQLIAYAKGKIDQALVKDVLGVAHQASVAEFVGMILDNDKGKGIDHLQKLVADGYDLEQFTKNLIEYLRKILLINSGAGMKDVILVDLSSEQLEKLQNQAKKVTVGRTVQLIKCFLEAQQNIGQAIYPQLPLELALIEVVGEDGGVAANSIESSPAEIRTEKKATVKKEPVAEEVRPVAPIVASQEPVSEPEKKEEPKKVTDSKEEVASNSYLDIKQIEAKWKNVIEDVMPINHSLAAFLRMGVLQEFQSGYVTIAFKFRFHKEQIGDHKYRTIVEDVMTSTFGEKVLLRCVVDDNLAEKEMAPPKKEEVANVEEAPQDITKMAQDMFGGKLV